MLQQTTTQAVIPYYERFLEKFPTLKSLALAPLGEVLSAWSGLGYYSRARNLHKSAKNLIEQPRFPSTWKELITYPGFGPYTSRSVSSLTFNESTGVVDGNVIRVLSRYYGKGFKPWKSDDKNHLQNLSDGIIQQGEKFGIKSSVLNQALMELGASVCTPQSPLCGVCPWSASCVAFQTHQVAKFPLKKPQRSPEIWLWKPQVITTSSTNTSISQTKSSLSRKIKSKPSPDTNHALPKEEAILFTRVPHVPVLKNTWLLPGSFEKLKSRPKRFDFQHSITHHLIYVKIQNPKVESSKRLNKQVTTSREEAKWVSKENVPKINPSSLITKVLQKSGVLAVCGLCLAISLFTAGCKSAPPSSKWNPSEQEVPPSPRAIDPQLGIQLNRHGSVQRLRWAEDQGSLFAIIDQKDSHRHTEIYQIFRTELRDKRWTFQDGLILDLLPRSGQVLYVSNTEMLKERPLLLNPETALKEIGPNDLFQIDSRGLSFERLELQGGNIRSLSWGHDKKSVIASFSKDGESYSKIFQWSLPLSSQFLKKRKELASSQKGNIVQAVALSSRDLFYLLSHKSETSLFHLQGRTASLVTPPPGHRILEISSVEGDSGRLLVSTQTGDTQTGNDPKAAAQTSENKSALRTVSSLDSTSSSNSSQFYIMDFQIRENCWVALLDSSSPLKSPTYAKSQKELAFVRQDSNQQKLAYLKSVDLEKSLCGKDSPGRENTTGIH